MNPNIRKKTILKKKLMKTTMLSTAIFVAFLFIGSSVAASLAGNNAATENNSDAIENSLRDTEISIGKAPIINSNTKSFTESLTEPSMSRGDTFYAVDAGNANFVWFDSDTPGTFNVIAPHGYPGFPQGACFVDDVYWTTDTNGEIYTVDETTGTMTYIGNSGTTEGLVGLAYDPSQGILYGGSTTDFYTIDMGTGVATHVGPYGGAVVSLMISIACDSDGNMYALELSFGDAPLHSIDTATGTATAIGGTGLALNFGQDIAYDIDNDILYGCLFNYNTYMGEFHTIDTTTGLATYVGDLDAGAQTTVFAIPYTSGPPPEHDVAVISIIEPKTGTGSVITPQIEVQNKGDNDEYGVPLNVKIGKRQVTGTPEDFEADDGGYTQSGDLWEWGTPTNGPGAAHSGVNVWATDLDGNYIYGTYLLYSPTITVPTGDSELVFWHWYDTEASWDGGNVKISNDSGVTWTILGFPYSGTANSYNPAIPDEPCFTGHGQGYWEKVSADISGYAGETVQFRWDFGADTSVFYPGWYVDDVVVQTILWVNEYDHDITFDILINETLNIIMPDWTPADLGLSENVDIDYQCEAELNFPDNNTGNNYKEKEFTLNYGYFNDIGVTEIVSPVDGEGGTQTPEVVVENFGQNDQIDAKVNMLIDVITYSNQWAQVQYSGNGVWERTDSSYTAPAYGSGYFMVADSDAHSGQTFDVEMFTHSMDMTGETSVDFSCAEHFQDLGSDDTAQIGIYSGGVLEETAYYQYGASDPYGGSVVNYNFDPTSYTDITDVQIGFYYSTGGGTWDWGFGIDDILLESATVTYIDWDFEIETFPPSEMTFTNVYDETATFDIDSGDTTNVILPDWTPPLPLTTVDYRITACTLLEGWTSVYTEGFEGYTPPSPPPWPPIDPAFGPWVIVDGGSTTDTWRWNSGSPPPGGSGGYAECDTDDAGSGVTMLEDLICTDPAVTTGLPVSGTPPFLVEYDYDLNTFAEDCTLWLSPDGISWFNPVDPALGPWGHFPPDSSGHAIWDAYTATPASLPGWPWPHVYVSWTYDNHDTWGYWFKMDNVLISDGGFGVLVNENFDGTPASGFPPAGWSQVIYSGTGQYEIGAYGSHSPYEPLGSGTYYALADSDAHTSDVFDVGLFTGSHDFTGETTVQISTEICLLRWVTDYVEVRTYSGGLLEEVLWNNAGQPGSTYMLGTLKLEFDPSGYSDPTDVQVEMYYSTQGSTWQYWFTFDDFAFNIPAIISDGDPSNDCMTKYITLEFLHDVGTVSIDEPSGTPVLTKGTLLYEDMEGTWITDPDGDPYMVPEDATFGAWDIDGLCVDSQAGYPQLTHYISQMADYGGYGLPYEGTYCAGAWWSDGNGGDTTQDEWLKTPDMDLSEYGNLELSFYGIWNWASTWNDHVYIKASTDGGTTWDILADLLQDSEYEQGAGGPGGTGWCWNEYEVVIDLSAYDQSPSLIIAYQLLGDPTMVAINYIDAIEITGDVAGTWLPGTYPVEATIENFGNYDENNFDVTAQIFLVGADDPFYNESYTVTTVMSPGDQESIIFPDVTFTDDDEGIYTLEVTTHLLNDEVTGNDQQTLTFTIDIPDIIPPVTTHEFTGTMGDNDWYVSDVTIIITGEDDGKSPSGIKAIYYSYDDVTYEEYTEPIVHTDDGEFELYYYAEDNAGNVEEVNGPFDFKKDATTPTIELTAEGSGGTWTLIADVDDETSDIAKVEFYVNDEFLGEVTSAPYEWEYTGASSGDIAQAIAYDNAGNSKVSDPVEAASLQSQSSPVWKAVQQNDL